MAQLDIRGFFRMKRKSDPAFPLVKKPAPVRTSSQGWRWKSVGWREKEDNGGNEGAENVGDLDSVSASKNGPRQRKCPFYKYIPNTSFTGERKRIRRAKAFGHTPIRT